MRDEMLALAQEQRERHWKFMQESRWLRAECSALRERFRQVVNKSKQQRTFYKLVIASSQGEEV
jgi:hypothetical protein